VFGLLLSPIGPTRFPGAEPLVLEYGGTVTHQAHITCDSGDGEHHVISSVAELSDAQTEWFVTETIFAFDSSAEVISDFTVERGNQNHAEAFTVVSSRDYSVPYDPTGEDPLPVPGDSCFALD
jgi:hypothetical protein